MKDTDHLEVYAHTLLRSRHGRRATISSPSFDDVGVLSLSLSLSLSLFKRAYKSHVHATGGTHVA